MFHCVDVLFRRDGELFEPTELARGPWSPDLLHGGAVGALLAELLQPAMSPAMTPARLSVDFLKPVPRRPLRVKIDALRRGRRMEVLRAVVTADGGDGAAVADGTLLALRSSPAAEPTQPSPAASARLPGGHLNWSPWLGLSLAEASFLESGLQVRYARPKAVPAEPSGRGAPPRAWFRLVVPVLGGDPPSPLARVAAGADLAGSVAMRRGEQMLRGFINADFSVNLLRLPIGEWLRFDAQAAWGQSGFGHVLAQVFDADGPMATTSSVLVDQPDASSTSWSPRRWQRGEPDQDAP